MKNLPTSNELEKFYSDFMRDDLTRPKNYQINYTKKEREHIKLLNELRIHAILKIRKKWNTKKISLLEIGVGEGFTIAHAASKGWSVHGIDFSSSGIKRFNPTIISKIEFGNAYDILKNTKRKYDLCMINNVLEHVIDPREVLKYLRRVLEKNGLIALTVPNDFSDIQKTALKLHHIKNKFWIDPPEHLHYFNTKNIQKFLNNQKFKIHDMYSSFPIDFFLYHPGSNYIENEKNGKGVHQARIELEVLLSKSGIENYHKLCQSFANCNVGRNFTVIISPKN